MGDYKMDESIPSKCLTSDLLTFSTSTESEEVLAAIYDQGKGLGTMMKELHEHQERHIAQLVQRYGTIQLLQT